MVSSAEWDFVVVLNDAHISNCFQPYYNIRPEKLHHSYSDFEIILVWDWNGLSGLPKQGRRNWGGGARGL